MDPQGFGGVDISGQQATEIHEVLSGFSQSLCNLSWLAEKPIKGTYADGTYRMVAF